MKKLSQICINESQQTYDNSLNFPPVESLGDGEYEGALWGHCFAYNGNKYYCEIGTRNIYPYKVSVVIKNGKFEPPFRFIDKFQHPELKYLFE